MADRFNTWQPRSVNPTPNPTPTQSMYATPTPNFNQKDVQLQSNLNPTPFQTQSQEDAAHAISQLFNLPEVQGVEFMTQGPGIPPSPFMDVVGPPQPFCSPTPNPMPTRKADKEKDLQQICYDFTKGRCGRGDKCKYSHDIATIVKFNSQEQGICFDFLRSQCDRGLLCKFSHDVSNIAHLYQQASNGQVGNANSTSICYNFLKGVCHKGNSCRYSHDLRVVMNTNTSQRSNSAASNSAAANASLNAGDAALALLQLLQGDASNKGNSSSASRTASQPLVSRPAVPKLPFTADLQAGAKDSLQSPTDVLAYALSQNSPHVAPFQEPQFQGVGCFLPSVPDRSLSTGLDLDQLIDQLTMLQTLSSAGLPEEDIRQALNLLGIPDEPTPQLPRTMSGSVRPGYDSQDLRSRVFGQDLSTPRTARTRTAATTAAFPASSISFNIWRVDNGNL